VIRVHVVYRVAVLGPGRVTANDADLRHPGTVRFGELQATPGTLLPIANAIWRRVRKDTDDPEAQVIVSCWDKHAALPEQERFAHASVLLGLAHGYPVGEGPTVWDECEKLLKWGAITEYGAYEDAADGQTTCLITPHDGPVVEDLEACFPTLVGAFKSGWLAARGQADPETWSPGEEHEISLGIQVSSWRKAIDTLRDHGGDAAARADELAEALSAELSAAIDEDRDEEIFKGYLMKAAALLAEFGL
jgi:hypothetical protein